MEYGCCDGSRVEMVFLMLAKLALLFFICWKAAFDQQPTFSECFLKPDIIVMYLCLQNSG